MASATATHTLRVQQLDRKYDLRIDIGTVTFGPQGELALVSPQPHFEGFLGKLIDTVNARPTLSVKVPPPEGGPPHGIEYVTVERTAPDLLDWMRQFLEQKYNLLLTEEPAASAAPAPLVKSPVADPPAATSPRAPAAAPASAAPAPLVKPPPAASHKPVSPRPPAPAPVAAVTPPPPPPPRGPSPLELLRDAAAREDRAAVQQHLLTLGVDSKICERLLAAWQCIVTPGAERPQRLAKMMELSETIRQVKGAAKVQEELWRLQKALTKYT